MKKRIALFLCLSLLAAWTSGCAGGPVVEPTEAPASAEPAPAVTEPGPEEAEPSPTEPPAASAEPVGQRGHYVFQPKVCASYMADIFGETMVETWFHLVDAVMAGEDHFACPDADTYGWVMGQFPDRCFPVLPELIDYCYDRSNPVIDGVASFTYLVPPEEAAARIADFAALVEDILNETLRDDSTDFEKALALYLYFSHHYTYDYEAARPDIYADYLSSYRVLTTGTGICQEFSVAYSYLLLQAGVDASVMSGHRSYDGASHQWSYIKLDGRDFHVDPTFVIGSNDSLSYFLMDDGQRELTGFLRNDYTICSHYSNDHPHPSYAADDGRFRELWQGEAAGWDPDSHILTYTVYDEPGVPTVLSLDTRGL